MIGRPTPRNNSRVSQEGSELNALALLEAKVLFTEMLNPIVRGKVTITATKLVDGDAIVTTILNTETFLDENQFMLYISADLSGSKCTIKIEDLQSISGDTLAQPVQVHVLPLSALV